MICVGVRLNPQLLLIKIIIRGNQETSSPKEDPKCLGEA